MSTRILVVGDYFVTVPLLKRALEVEIQDQTPIELRDLTLPWPDVAFGQIAEVEEASGSEDELIAALEGVQICVTQMAPLTEKVLAAAPDLKLFVVTRGGPVNANIPAATKHGVAVCYAPGRNATAATEHTMGVLLATMRRIPETHAALQQGHWKSDYYRYENCGIELEGATVGLIGSGAIGGRIAHILKSFGCNILIYDPYVAPDAFADIAEKVDTLEELLQRSQIVSLHARATPETKGMIGAAQLALMPRGSVLINCARGSLLDYDALCDALESGHLFGAGLDVFPEEPLPADARLLRMPNAIVTPHIAGASQETAQKAACIAAAEVGRYLRGEPLAHCANPDVERRH